MRQAGANRSCAASSAARFGAARREPRGDHHPSGATSRYFLDAPGAGSCSDSLRRDSVLASGRPSRIYSTLEIPGSSAWPRPRPCREGIEASSSSDFGRSCAAMTTPPAVLQGCLDRHAAADGRDPGSRGRAPITADVPVRSLHPGAPALQAAYLQALRLRRRPSSPGVGVPADHPRHPSSTTRLSRWRLAERTLAARETTTTKFTRSPVTVREALERSLNVAPRRASPMDDRGSAAWST